MSEEQTADAQKRRDERRKTRAEQDAPTSEDRSEKITPVPLSVMLGEGNTVEIGGKSYEVAAFPVSKLGRVGELIGQCPDLLVSLAFAAAETGRMGATEVADVMNRVRARGGAEGDPTEAASVQDGMDALAINISEESAAAMTPLVVLALSRRHPDIVDADIEDDLDLDRFLAVLCKIFTHPGNRPLVRRF